MNPNRPTGARNSQTGQEYNEPGQSNTCQTGPQWQGTGSQSQLVQGIKNLQTGQSDPMPPTGSTQQRQFTAPGYELIRRSHRRNTGLDQYHGWRDAAGVKGMDPKAALLREEVEYLRTKGIEFIGEIGSGGYGVVYRCRASQLLTDHFGNQITQEVACKVMSKSYTQDFTTRDTVTKLQLEGDIHRQLRHQNIVRCYGVYYVSEPKTGYPFMRTLIFMELMSGDLFDVLERVGRQTEREARVWFRQIARALKYLHDRHIVHYDIKLENILYKDDLSPRHRVFKLTDFGFSHKYGSDAEAVDRYSVGTKGYKAPEVLGKNARSFRAKPVDVYALGVCLANAFAGNNDQMLIRAAHNGLGFNRWGIGTCCAQFISYLCAGRADQRLTADSMQTHSWFTRN